MGKGENGKQPAPLCVCVECGWEGLKEQLAEFCNDAGEWYFVCPLCNSEEVGSIAWDGERPYTTT